MRNKNTCNEADIGNPSFNHEKYIGISPEITVHASCALSPDLRFGGNDNGERTGGLLTIS